MKPAFFASSYLHTSVNTVPLISVKRKGEFIVNHRTLPWLMIFPFKWNAHLKAFYYYLLLFCLDIVYSLHEKFIFINGKTRYIYDEFFFRQWVHISSGVFQSMCRGRATSSRHPVSSLACVHAQRTIKNMRKPITCLRQFRDLSGWAYHDNTLIIVNNGPFYLWK